MKDELFFAKAFRLTFDGGEPFLCVGPGDHSGVKYKLTWDQVRGLVLDAMPELLKR